MTAMGSGYTDIPIVTIADNFSTWSDATAVMTEQNPLHSITYQGTNPTLFLSTPTATITGTTGTGATADVTISTTGEVIGYTALVGGTGYATAPEVTISGGGGFGATATATSNGIAATLITIDDGGQGYTSNPTFSFTGGGGTGASATAVRGFPVTNIALNAAGIGYEDVTSIFLDDGTVSDEFLSDCDVKFNMGVRRVALNDGGEYFSAAPSVSFTPVDVNGSGAAATALITWDIMDLVVDTPGSGYILDEDDDVTVLIDPPAGAGVQAEASPVLGNGVLSGVEISNHGQGYTAPPNVFVLEDDGDGGFFVPVVTSGAEVAATVSGGAVTALTITDPGSGYDFDTYANGDYEIEITTYNSLAEAEAQANPESGQIDYIQLTHPGAGYMVAPTVEIYNSSSVADANGFGSGAVATSTIVDGRVTAITLTNPGSGYYITPTVNLTVPWSSMTAVGRCIVNADGRITGVEFTGGYPFTQGYGY